MKLLVALLLYAHPALAAAVQQPTATPGRAGTASASTGEPWRIVPLPQSSLVLARDGSLVGEVGRQWRTSVALRTLPRFVGQAFVATEDKRFYQHNGVDVVGIAGALKDAVTGDARGASTITQQLVGNMHPDVVDRRDRTLGRKLREQEAALEMERHYSKEQILEGYLNTISFGHGWHGIESAARHYFGKGAAQLQLHEVASLAALPKGPALYDPIKYPERNRERRNTVLALMAQQKYISDSQMRQAQAQPVAVAPNGGMSVAAPYFVDAVRVYAERLGVRLADGGYRVHTTLDPALQRAATLALVEGTAAVEARAGYRHLTYAKKQKGQTDYLQGMVVALDARTGDVRALVGGRNYQDSPFNRATNALRQPGSSFKPYVYAAAIADSAITAASVVQDTALAIRMGNGRLYAPDNADNEFLGPLSLRDALAKSRNPVAVQLWQELGADTIVALARRVGLGTPIAPYPSSALGASAVRPLDYVAAFTVFANDGRAAEPRLVARIEDRAGKVVAQQAPTAGQEAMDPAVAFIVRDMMRDVVEKGTATSVRRYLPPSVPAAGKTGTSNDNADVWFVGATPDLVGGVWLGFDRPKTITPGAAGGSLAAPIWARVMAAWYGGRGAADWTPPPGVVTAEIDRLTGEAPTADTPADRRANGFFLEGTEPGARRFDPWRLFRWGADRAVARERAWRGGAARVTVGGRPASFPEPEPPSVTAATAPVQSSDPEALDTRRVLAFDGLRGIGIMCVIAGHVIGQYMKPVSWVDWLARFAMQPLWGAIDGFFVLSGLLITGILIDSKGKPAWWRTFLLRRTLRIFPVYFAFLAVIFLALPLLAPDNPDVRELVQHQAWYWTYTNNILHVVHPETVGIRFHQGHLWSLAVEEQFYLLWPLVIFLCRPTRLLQVTLGLLAASVVARLVFLQLGLVQPFATYVLTPFHLDGLMLGAALAVVVRTPGGLARVGKAAPWVLLAAALAMVGITWWRGIYSFSEQWSVGVGILVNALGAASIATLAMTSTLRRGLYARFFESRIFTICGRYSYGMYVIHFAVLHALTYGRDWNVGRADVLRGATLPSVLLLTLLVFTISFVLAMASYELYEKRFLRMGRRYRTQVLPGAGGEDRVRVNGATTGDRRPLPPG